MLTLRLVAAGLVIGAAWGLGRQAARPFSLRVRTLEEWRRFLQHLVPLIVWRRIPLREALVEAVRGQPELVGSVSRFVEMSQDPDVDFSQAWVDLLQNMPGLWEADRRVLNNLGLELGMSDAQYQEEHLATAQAELGRLLDEARVKRAHDGRLVPALVTALGVMVVIMML